MNLSFLTNTLLFRGSSVTEIEEMLRCFGTSNRTYSKNEIIFHSGEVIDSFGLVISGCVNIERDDIWGNRSILSQVTAGQTFAESYASIAGQPLTVNAVACERTEIMLLNASRILTSCQIACGYHNRVIRNMVSLIAAKNLELSKKIMHTSSKSIRGRLISYLSEQARRAGGYQFTIGFNRQQLADYLEVDRSTMCNELSKMQKDGLIEYSKNSFTVKIEGE